MDGLGWYAVVERGRRDVVEKKDDVERRVNERERVCEKEVRLPVRTAVDSVERVWRLARVLRRALASILIGIEPEIAGQLDHDLAIGPIVVVANDMLVFARTFVLNEQILGVIVRVLAQIADQTFVGGEARVQRLVR